MLVAAISDFSLRGGFNTTKYTLSTNNGSTWKQAFIPRNSAGLPLTSDGAAWQANSDPVVAIDPLFWNRWRFGGAPCLDKWWVR